MEIIRSVSGGKSHKVDSRRKVSGGQVLSLQFGNSTDDQHLVKLVVQARIIALYHDWMGREPLILPLGYDNLYVLLPQYPGPTLVIGECLSHLGLFVVILTKCEFDYDSKN